MTMLEAVKKMKGPFNSRERGSEQKVEFTFYAPEAKKVNLAGKFNNWDTKTLPMKKGKDGVWKTSIPLSSGRYEYKYFVDGSWAQDIPCSEMILNPFGTYNCVIGVE
ncbi:MAG TPA: isoamylase early set domain-containing protein [Nitrospirota bacterium]